MVKIEHILHPTDCGENSNHALKYACSLATQFSANLHILNVVEDLEAKVAAYGAVMDMDLNEKNREVAMEKINELPDKVIDHQGDVTRHIIEGEPFIEIIKYAKKNAIDLIVMGTHGYTGLEHLLIGSVAENVVRKASCPVLVIPSTEHEFVMP
jgi:nucleotide-binding universal stress UspA family protein